MSDQHDEEQEAGDDAHVGAILRRAREGLDMSLDDIAKRTRVPLRSLENIEAGNYDALPAPTYATGFVKSYAREVGLNEQETGQAFRDEIQFRTASETARNYYEPADPARVPPRMLAWTAALIAIVLVIAYAIWRGTFSGDSRDPARLAAGTEQTDTTAPATSTPRRAQRPRAAPAASGPVVLEAEDEVWLRVYEFETDKVLFQGELAPGETYQVPANAARPAIRTGRAEALRVTVGGRRVAPLGPASTTISDVAIDARSLASRGRKAETEE